jgi:hypothetical protein
MEECIGIMPSGKIARFPNIYIARAMILKKYHTNIFVSSDDIFQKLTHEAILVNLRKYSNGQELPLLVRADAIEAARELWKTWYEQADHILKQNSKGKITSVASKEPGEEDEFALRVYWVIYEPGKDPQQDASFIRLTPQARQCMELLMDKFGLDIVSEEKVFRAFTLDTEIIKTRQDKWRIFKYYRSSLVSKNFLRMKG